MKDKMNDGFILAVAIAFLGLVKVFATAMSFGWGYCSATIIVLVYLALFVPLLIAIKKNIF